ncbi:MAG TPA: prepilin-type N-terminal cleavage/methylation domain-containing protein [Smithellaceae bacterium]|nr:prepilin-type N-terminal cleavage/methylation domain-containing protein [Smithellaceae bacterium]HRS88749.1 prepilin-type N-terminal cleavage/methylation domain-containing protein [Smithellaceae bacterium]HRV26520.1 prepilin-type N-terminal cleavage/methylation domain-containing protein [Smithellaceae bacterium]
MNITKNKGMTLIEMMVVVIILGIVLAIATPNFVRYRQNTNLRESTEDFTAQIALYKQRAIAEDIRYRIAINLAAGEYSVERNPLPETPDVYVPLVPAVTKKFNQYSSQIIVVSAPVSIVMQPRGTLTAGTLVLRHTGTQRRAEIVTHLSGRVNVEYKDS